jgi:lysozyme family protein
MADWDTCYNWMMDNEDRTRDCKIVPDPTSADHTAQAISGINSAYYPEWFARIAALPQDQRPPVVKDFYKTEFWNRWFNIINSDEVAKRVLDAAVNMGPGTSVKLLQRAFNSSCNPSSTRLREDGAWGPGTVQSANSVEAGYLVIEFKRVRLGYYQDIVQKDPSKSKYLGTQDHPGAWWIRATA